MLNSCRGLTSLGRWHVGSACKLIAAFAAAPYADSAVYNGIYILGEMVISGIIIYLIFKRMPQLLNA